MVQKHPEYIAKFKLVLNPTSITLLKKLKPKVYLVSSPYYLRWKVALERMHTHMPEQLAYGSLFLPLAGSMAWNKTGGTMVAVMFMPPQKQQPVI